MNLRPRSAPRRPPTRFTRALYLGVCLATMTASASNLGFLKDSPLAYFAQNDNAMMLDNARKVLDATAPHAKSAWSNPKTGSSGEAEVLSQFTTEDGTLCKRLRLVNRAGGLEGSATHTVCHDKQRGWVPNPHAAPPAS